MRSHLNVAGAIFGRATLCDKVEVEQNLPPPPPHSSSLTAEMVFKNFTDDGGEKVMAMMMRLVQACECDISVFYTVPPVAMAPLNMGGTLQQQQSGVFVRFYSGALSLPFNPLHYLQHCIRGWFALACVVFSGGWWVLVYRPGQSASCKFRRP